jgi:DNA polymerase III epsilon subunit-like protein
MQIELMEIHYHFRHFPPFDNLPRYQAHHALSDALATAELLQAQVAPHYSAATSCAHTR